MVNIYLMICMEVIMLYEYCWEDKFDFTADHRFGGLAHTHLINSICLALA